MSKENKELNLEEELYKKHFRVSIFGSARIKPEDEIYKKVYDLAKDIGHMGIDIVTGGGPGLMDAANSGHQVGNVNHDSHSIGFTIKLPVEKDPNSHLDLKKHFQRFSKRLDYFMAVSNVAVVMTGGLGTCLELFYTWQLIQVKHISPMPIILVGDMWEDLMDWIKKWVLKNELMNESDLDIIYLVKNNEEAMQIIRDRFEKYQESDDNMVQYHPEG